MPRASSVAARWGPTPWRYLTELVKEMVGIGRGVGASLLYHWLRFGCVLRGRANNSADKTKREKH
jgi:hypothetical protein